MEKFGTITSLATPFLQDNVDTDTIFPGKHLKIVKRYGLGNLAFEGLRLRADGSPKADCIFNRDDLQGSKILLAGENFGCGSSREHAAWVLEDMGFRVIIAPSFADIFASNCFRNGILTVTIPNQALKRLAFEFDGMPITVDLKAQEISLPEGEPIAFDVDIYQKEVLLAGLDEIAATLQREAAIRDFEDGQRQAAPWLWERKT
ncbi:MAG: 3-isopropylmalate dehydratase small subunit [Sphingomonadales bacterium]